MPKNKLSAPAPLTKEQLRALPLEMRAVRFVECYAKTWDARQSAIAWGVAAGDADKWAPKLMKDPLIRDMLADWLGAYKLETREITGLLEQQARALHTQYFTDDGGFDLPALRAAGLMHLIKSITPGRYGSKIEFVDSQAALMFLARIRNLVGQDSTASSSTVTIVIPDNRRDPQTNE